jgi:hypothetical protein
VGPRLFCQASCAVLLVLRLVQESELHEGDNCLGDFIRQPLCPVKILLYLDLTTPR